MNIHSMGKAISVLALATLSMSAGAATKVYSFNLDGSQEATPNASPAAGSAQFTVDDVLGSIDFALVGFNLSGTFSAAHIHGPAPAGINAGVVLDLVAAASAAPGPVTIGPVVLANSISFAGTANNPGLASLINATPWMYYVNVHTSAYPSGEIRGQLAPIPEPEAYAMMLAGLGLVGLMAYRRKSRSV